MDPSARAVRVRFQNRGAAAVFAPNSGRKWREPSTMPISNAEVSIDATQNPTTIAAM